MIYAINKRTKEHRRANASNTSGWTSPYCNWSVVMADAEGWIEWDGGECPLPDDTRVKLRTRNGVEHRLPVHAGNQRWGHGGGQYDIIAYRPILDADTKPEAPEWDGRGLPPVGARCAGRHTSFRTDFECTIMAINDGKVWFVDHMDDSDRDFVYPLTCVSFRPIRSEEDRLVEQALKDISAEPDEYGADSVVYRMIKAGYRKTGGDT